MMFRNSAILTKNKCIISFFIIFFILFLVPVRAEIEINNIRLGVHGERTRLVIELSELTKYEILVLKNPYRLVVDLGLAKWNKTKTLQNKLISNVRFGTFRKDKSRIVLDIKKPFAMSKHFILPPSVHSKYYRLVIDIEQTKVTKLQTKTRKVIKQSPKGIKKDPGSKNIGLLLGKIRFTPLPRPQKLKPVIVLDPGHGGIDPGAIGKTVKEKDVVLKFAHHLAKKIIKTGRYQVYLTRHRDVYVPLRERVQFAQNKQADLFISLHADAIKKKNIRGMSVYTLSNHASDKEAAALARKENKSDIIAGLDFSDVPPEATNILINLAQRDSKNRSIQLADILVENMKKTTRLLENPRRSAGFRVLKAPKIPSILVELGFLTNRQDERMVQSKKWRNIVVNKFVHVIDTFFHTKYNIFN